MPNSVDEDEKNELVEGLDENDVDEKELREGAVVGAGDGGVPPRLNEKDGVRCVVVVVVSVSAESLLFEPTLVELGELNADEDGNEKESEPKGTRCGGVGVGNDGNENGAEGAGDEGDEVVVVVANENAGCEAGDATDGGCAGRGTDAKENDVDTAEDDDEDDTGGCAGNVENENDVDAGCVESAKGDGVTGDGDDDGAGCVGDDIDESEKEDDVTGDEDGDDDSIDIDGNEKDIDGAEDDADNDDGCAGRGVAEGNEKGAEGAGDDEPGCVGVIGANSDSGDGEEGEVLGEKGLLPRRRRGDVEVVGASVSGSRDQLDGDVSGPFSPDLGGRPRNDEGAGAAGEVDFVVPAEDESGWRKEGHAIEVGRMGDGDATCCVSPGGTYP